MKQTEKKYQCIPFWSWNDTLKSDELVKQIEWMNDNGVGGFFMHARGGLKTEYLGKEWFEAIKACSEKAQELGMEAYAYDENGWPSGFVGGRLLDDMENHDRYLTFSLGEYDENAYVSYDLTGEKIVRIVGGGKAYKNCLNVYQHYSASTVDILNGEVVDKFIALTHEEYKKRDTYDLKGFFTDEPQYFRWGLAYTKVLAPYFKETYGEDILDGLGLLFVDKEGYRAFRYKYWKAMQTLMVENFGKKIYDWCEQNGYKLTGHYVEEGLICGQMMCCAGIMPFYEYEHIPGIDWLNRRLGDGVAPRQVASVAAQLGKEQTMTETYGCCGWDVTPKELKEIAECQYVAGINLMCQHLLPYKEHGQRKRDYPAHFSHWNPWISKGFKEFNDYFSVLGKTLATSKEAVNVGFFHPLRSAYFDFKRWTSEDEKWNLRGIDDPFCALTARMAKMNIPYHYLDETLLAKYGRVEGKRLVVGLCAYDFIVFPRLYTMDKTTEKLLREYVNAGGRVLLTDGKPTYLEGEPFVYDYLESNVSWEEIIKAQPYQVLGVEGAGKDFRSTYRTDADGKPFIYAVNLGEDVDVEITTNCNAFSSYDILKDEYTLVPKKLHFEKGQSRLLYLTDEEPVALAAKKPLYLGKEFTVCGDVENTITLDFLRYSTDGVSYSEPLHHMGVFNEMLEKRYKGRLYLKYECNVSVLPTKCQLLAEDTNVHSVSVNGKRVERCGSSTLEQELLAYDVAKELKLGKNEFVIEMDYFQSEQVYYALFGENVTETLKNCLAYDTDIEAVYLKGDFGVYGTFEKGQTENVVLGKDFTLGAQKKTITSLIEEGYPFFVGDITLKQTLSVEDTDRELVINERFHLLEVKMNGEYAGRLMLGERMDLSKLLKKGENEIEIVLTVGNRNWLGPFHAQKEEPFDVGPNTFERLGTWKDGKSNILRESYSFVKTIL